MNQPTQTHSSGSYTANLIGNIKSHLAGLQGYDVMALELIQNADDAKAEEIVFDITDQGLRVFNNKKFTYCGDLNQLCNLNADIKDSCDFHRIVDVGSGNKLSKGDNIGRFGIGFVSTYQITDHPEIQSTGIKLTLKPEEGKWSTKTIDECDGTTFFLPWADDPNANNRLALDVSHITAANIDQLTEECIGVLRESLLFLHHVRKAEVRRNGNMLFACELDRSGESDLIVSFKPSGEIEQWHILRADATESATCLFADYPRLESLGRSAKISIGLRIDPEPLAGGLLYAFLPTEQSTGLPLHINADFFPEPDRKSIIFKGHQHEEAWNVMLIRAAAVELAKAPESLLQMLGDEQLWQILDQAYELSTSSGHPDCFKSFWERLQVTASQTHIALTQDGSVQCPIDIFLPDRQLNPLQEKMFLDLGGRIGAEKLRRYRKTMIQLGGSILTLKRMINLIDQGIEQNVPMEIQVEEQKLKDFYRPLWSMVNDLLPDLLSLNPGPKSDIKRLKAVPFIVTEGLWPTSINMSFLPRTLLGAARVAELLPKLQFASHHLIEFPKLARLVSQLELGDVVSHISFMYDKPDQDAISVEMDALRDLYALFSDLDSQGKVDQSVYEELRDLPIWLSSRGLVKASVAQLPGDFNDPTGEAEILDPTALTELARDFISIKLKVSNLTIKAYVQEVLPSFFDEDGPKDLQKYRLLVTELANHSDQLIYDERIRVLLGQFQLVPTKDGNWSTPGNTYRQTSDLAKVLGNATHLWLDPERFPSSQPVSRFLDDLGIRKSPSAGHLVARMIDIAERAATGDAKKASSEAFYILCDRYDEWKDKKPFQDAIAEFKDVQCFPADDDEQWYFAADLYYPIRSAAFKSQALILDFKNPVRLKKELLEELGFSMTPETKLLIRHLQYCVKCDEEPHVFTYEELNERAKKEDSLITQLRGTRCVYVENEKKFVRPNQLYWTAQQLGRYTFTIPEKLENLKPLFTAIGVKDAPDAGDLVELLIDVVDGYHKEDRSVEGADLDVYKACLSGISTADNAEELDDEELQLLQNSYSILNLLDKPKYPDALLLQDSEWHAKLLKGKQDQALCKPARELWSLFEKIGVQRLSKCAKVELEIVEGEKKAEMAIADKLLERAEIIERMLHDKPMLDRKKVAKAFSTLKAFSHDIIRIQATVSLGGYPFDIPPSATQAFYDIDQRHLILARPVNERSWAPILNSLFYQLMPEEPGSEISKLTLSVDPLMEMSLEEAHRKLTEVGIPYLEVERGGNHGEDLTSPELGGIGGSFNSGDELDRQQDGPPTDPDKDETVERQDAVSSEGKPQLQSSGENSSPDKDETVERQDAVSSEGKPQLQSSGEDAITQGLQHGQKFGAEREKKLDEKIDLASDGDSNGRSPVEGGAKKPRSKERKQRDQRLLSYVLKKVAQSGETEGQENLSEHNLAVEVIARDAVCTYERERGRIPEEMPQTHPGFDIISRTPLTNEERIIEVKGVSGQWNKTGVGLSSFQFTSAQKYGDRYWLYVVEFVSDPEHLRVHPICNPAAQVGSFMFDGNWRDAVSDEIADPALAFVPGARVRHQSWGFGRIKSLELQGTMRILKIDFEGDGLRPVPLNLQTMTVVEDEEDDDNDHS